MILRAVDRIHVDTFHTAQTQCQVEVGGGTRGSTSGIACWEVPIAPGLPKLSPVAPWQQGQLLGPTPRTEASLDARPWGHHSIELNTHFITLAIARHVTEAILGDYSHTLGLLP